MTSGSIQSETDMSGVKVEASAVIPIRAPRLPAKLAYKVSHSQTTANYPDDGNNSYLGNSFTMGFPNRKRTSSECEIQMSFGPDHEAARTMAQLAGTPPQKQFAQVSHSPVPCDSGLGKSPVDLTLAARQSGILGDISDTRPVPKSILVNLSRPVASKPRVIGRPVALSSAFSSLLSPQLGVTLYRCTWSTCHYSGIQRSEVVQHIRRDHLKREESGSDLEEDFYYTEDQIDLVTWRMSQLQTNRHCEQIKDETPPSSHHTPSTLSQPSWPQIPSLSDHNYDRRHLQPDSLNTPPSLAEHYSTSLPSPSHIQTHAKSQRPGRSETKKCRKIFGIEQRNLWCTQCKWKKACTRFAEPSTSPLAGSLPTNQINFLSSRGDVT